MKDIFEVIKGQVSILEIASRYCRGHTQVKGGKHWIISPFSTEKTPSCQLLPGTNSFRCFSSDYKGDLITFVALIYGIKNIEAAYKIAEDFNIPVDRGKVKFDARKAKAVEDKRRQELDTATYLITKLEVFYHKAVENFKLYDGVLQEIGNVLKPDDELLKELVLNRNKWENILHEFISGDIETRYKLLIAESEELRI